jgi:uncharacterized protein YneF (UPF0154 family)
MTELAKLYVTTPAIFTLVTLSLLIGLNLGYIVSRRSK